MDEVEEHFFGNLLKYLKFVKPHLKGHSKNNEMECVGSQYLHLYKFKDFIVFRNEKFSTYCLQFCSDLWNW